MHDIQPTASIKRYIDAMREQRILVIGDIMLDRFVFGAVDRLSPESDAPVLDTIRTKTMPGGAGNVVANLQALGAGSRILSVIGNDLPGTELCTLMPGNEEGLLIVESRPTTLKTRFVHSGGQLLRVDSETRTDIDPATEKRLLEKAKVLLAECDALILSDYNKGVLTPSLLRSVIDLAKGASVKILVDPKKADYSLYQGADVITPNRKELSQATGLPVNSDEETTCAARKLMQEKNIESLIVTRSEQGISVFEKDKDSVHIPAAAQKVTDVSGAGDTSIAALAAALAAGASLTDAAMIANKAGGLSVGKAATATVTPEEIKSAIAAARVTALPDRTREAPLCTWNDAAAQIAQWQKEGLTVGFTNGCFDILHYGHVNYLNRARERCDRLVLGLNSDSSVRILKGPERPLHDETARATVLGALGAVDMVVLFGAEREGQDNTPCALIEKIRPDMYFKGGDYTIDQLPEAAIMASFGGKTEIMPLYEGHSTTSTIRKMKKTGSGAA